MVINKREIMEDLKQYLFIGEAAKYLDKTKETLRNWHTNGKLIPDIIYSSNKYRMYSIKQLEEFKIERSKSKEDYKGK